MHHYKKKNSPNLLVSHLIPVATHNQPFSLVLGPAVGRVGRSTVLCVLVTVHKMVPVDVGAYCFYGRGVDEMLDVVT